MTRLCHVAPLQKKHFHQRLKATCANKNFISIFSFLVVFCSPPSSSTPQLPSSSSLSSSSTPSHAASEHQNDESCQTHNWLTFWIKPNEIRDWTRFFIRMQTQLEPRISSRNMNRINLMRRKDFSALMDFSGNYCLRNFLDLNFKSMGEEGRRNFVC